jgi:hypothetical protein
VYPELVTRSNDAIVQSVWYLEFTALLINELQKQSGRTNKPGRQAREPATELYAKVLLLTRS